MVPVGLGIRALKGGAVVVGVAADGPAPHVVLSTFLPTAARDDRLALEPYRVAAEMRQNARDGFAEAVAEGCMRQRALAVKELGSIVRTLREAGYEPLASGLLVNRAGWVTDLLEYSLAFPEHVPVAEGLAVRAAIRFALGQIGLYTVEQDEKSLPGGAAKQFGVSLAELDARLKALGGNVGPPWRKEQKLACLAAWMAVPAGA